jgi:mono/diheme cytochrome c family protein
MKTAAKFSVLAFLLAPAMSGEIQSADSKRGADIFRSHSCVECHSIQGKGGTIGPDLGKALGRGYHPAGFAALMWNHAPTMWSAMEKQGLKVTALSEQQAADLFAYFYSVRLFDMPSDASRGKQLLTSKHCVECHGNQASAAAGAPAVRDWQSVGRPLQLASAMWNHGASMRQAFAAKKIAWPVLTGQDLSDIALYARTLPGSRSKPAEFEARLEEGKQLFTAKGCAGCHNGKLSLEPRLTGKTVNDIGAAMWNHLPSMQPTAPNLTGHELEQVVTYLWAEQVRLSKGDANRGRKVFVAKNCVSCHEGASPSAPSLADRKGSFSSIVMISALWSHGPRMLEQVRSKGVPWPHFSQSEMSDLIAYLNTK